jgi:hypothetical protein
VSLVLVEHGEGNGVYGKESVDRECVTLAEPPYRQPFPKHLDMAFSISYECWSGMTVSVILLGNKYYLLMKRGSSSRAKQFAMVTVSMNLVGVSFTRCSFTVSRTVT